MSTAPLTHFGFVTHFGGGQRATALLVDHLARTTAVEVIDAYGGCALYMDALAAAGVEPMVLDRDAARQTIGGGAAARVWRVGRAAPGLARVIRRLRGMLAAIRPAVLWVDSEKALFCAARATADVPLVFYARGAISSASWYCRRDWQRLAGVCAISQATLATLPADCAAAPVRAVVPNVVSTADLARRAAVAGPLPARADLTVLVAATLIPLKAQHLAIEGLARHRTAGSRARLWLAGDVPAGDASGYAAALARHAAATGVTDAVDFLGWRDDVPALIARADVVALTSETEGLPGILLEAMALGKPVVATRVGGIPELIRDGWNGILIPPGDADAFAGALARLGDPALRATMGDRGRTAVATTFAAEPQARAFASFLGEAAAGWHARRAATAASGSIDAPPKRDAEPRPARVAT